MSRQVDRHRSVCIYITWIRSTNHQLSACTWTWIYPEQGWDRGSQNVSSGSEAAAPGECRHQASMTSKHPKKLLANAMHVGKAKSCALVRLVQKNHGVWQPSDVFAAYFPCQSLKGNPGNPETPRTPPPYGAWLDDHQGRDQPNPVEPRWGKEVLCGERSPHPSPWEVHKIIWKIDFSGKIC